MSRKKSEGIPDEMADVGASSTVDPSSAGVGGRKRTVKYWLCQTVGENGGLAIIKEFRSLQGAKGFAEGVKCLPDYDVSRLRVLKGKFIPLV
jgi:hypothetical protein